MCSPSHEHPHKAHFYFSNENVVTFVGWFYPWKPRLIAQFIVGVSHIGIMCLACINFRLSEGKQGVQYKPYHLYNLGTLLTRDTQFPDVSRGPSS